MHTLVEVACDESGYEGDKLIGTTTAVFAHASVRLDFASATDFIRELRDRIRSPATEYKANHVLRAKHRSVLTWLLGLSSPLLGTAHVYLIDKAFFSVRAVLDLLVENVDAELALDLRRQPRDGHAAVALYREGPRAFGGQRWEDFLVACNNLMRAKERHDVSTSVDTFFQLVRELRRTAEPGTLDEILAALLDARPHADSFRARLLDDPRMIPAMDPLLPAIVGAVDFWGEAGEPVAIVHDRQKTLTEDRIAVLKQICREPDPAPPGSPGGHLARLTFTESFHDPRIQVADVIAGAVRKLASDELLDRGSDLTALLPPYVDRSSIWADERSWMFLAPPGG